MQNLKGSPVASIIPTTRKGDHNYAKIQLESTEIASNTIIKQANNTISTILCTHAIPFHMSIPEFLEFVAPIDSFVSHYRVIRDTTPDSYMILLKFRDPYSANGYYKQYNNRPFSSMEPEKCNIVFIESIEIDTVTLPAFTFLSLNTQEEEDTLPTCPVCLEPMDEDTTGLLTILCQHTFHSHCLSKWGDGSCPICRYSHKSPPVAGTDTDLTLEQKHVPTERIIGQEGDENECSGCKSTENLWVCLICGHIGCGRYLGAHAYDHYRETSHLYSLEIDTQRVWDYTGDGYVHRLIQNVVDGKLVKLSESTETVPGQTTSQEKVEAISLEYNYLLTSQLDSQRLYYDHQMDHLSQQLAKSSLLVKTLTVSLNEIMLENELIEKESLEKEKQILDVEKSKEKADKKLESWKEKCEGTKQVWLEEKEMTNSLLENNSLLLKSMEEREKAIKELSDQVRDLMFFLEAREKVQGHPELEGGNLETHTPKQHHKSHKGKRKH